MKKLISLLAAVLLSLALCAGATAETVDYTGVWTLDSVVYDGTEMAAAELQASMILNADGTCELSALGLTQQGTWVVTENGLATTDADGVVEAYELIDGQLVFTQDENSWMIFSRADGTAINYAGFWLLTKISAAGQEVDPSAFGLEMYMVLNEDGTGVVGTNAQEESCTWTAVAEGLSMTDSKGDTDIVTYANGALTISDQGMTLHFTPYVQEAYPMPLSGLTLADFSGLWTLSYIEGPEDFIDPAEGGLSMTISLSGEEGRVEMIVPGDSIAYEMFCETEEIEGDGTVLYGTFLDSETGELTDAGMVFQLYDDGMLVYYEYNEEEDNTYLYCFDKVVTE
ncbi:MAG: hypothetical protein IJA77_07255 [Clostridia bacterium]|nr:hypothetical protein [Clostridia bacterium]